MFSSCGGVINDVNGQIRYPSSGYYENNKNCVWEINSSVPIYVQFTKFVLERDNSCEYDYVQIKENGVSLGKFCGMKLPNNIRTTSAGSVKVIFHSDSNIRSYGFVLDIGR